MNYEYIFDEIVEKTSEECNIIDLVPLSDEEKEVINPLVPPTSGLRMQIFDVNENVYRMTKEKFFHFLRVIKAISVVGKQELKNDNPSVLIVADDRPTAKLLIDFSSRIFSYEGYKIYQQDGEGTKSRKSSYIRGKSSMSTPYGSASIALFDKIDLVLVLTASHNSLDWNGLKYYIERPIPISGGVMKAVSKYALGLEQIKLSKSYKPELIDADGVNNEYIKKLVAKIVDCSVLNGKKVIIWPFLGDSPELVDLIESYGAKVILVDENTNPPDPTHGFDEDMIKRLMKENDVKIAVLLDADRDRLVFLVKSKDEYVKLTSNELYTSMMNILVTKLGKNCVNVRTIPSDPRCDKNCLINFVTGVGYKHLGLIQYLAADKKVPQSQLDTAILYNMKEGAYNKLHTHEDVKAVLNTLNVTGDIIFALWEESGGHTFNILNATRDNNELTLRSEFPLIGDKYPAPAILVLCTLLEMGYDLTEYLDQTIKGTRTTINATDEKKIKFLDYFSKKMGDKINVAGKEYVIGSFSNLQDKITVIYFKSEDSMLYARPSGTGPSVRIYIFGNHTTYQDELKNIAQYINSLDF